MLTLKGAEVSAKLKEQVLETVAGLGGYVPTAAIVRVGERPDDLSYEKGVLTIACLKYIQQRLKMLSKV